MRSPADKKILVRFVEVGPTINFATAIRCLLSRDEVKTYQSSQLLAPTGALIVTVGGLLLAPTEALIVRVVYY